MKNRKIDANSIEFKNFKEAVEKNKIKNTGTEVDIMVYLLKKNNIKLSRIIQG